MEWAFSLGSPVDCWPPKGQCLPSDGVPATPEGRASAPPPIVKGLRGLLFCPRSGMPYVPKWPAKGLRDVPSSPDRDVTGPRPGVSGVTRSHCRGRSQSVPPRECWARIAPPRVTIFGTVIRHSIGTTSASVKEFWPSLSEDSSRTRSVSDQFHSRGPGGGGFPSLFRAVVKRSISARVL